MKIRRFKGKDMRDALNQVKEELGADAVIMSNKKCADGIELVAAYDKEPVQASPTQAVSTQRISRTNTPQAIKPSATLSEIIGDTGQDSLQALLEKQLKPKTTPVNAQSYAPTPKPAQDNSTSIQDNFAWGNQQASSMQHVSEAETQGHMSDLRAEIASLKQVLTSQVSDLFEQQQKMRNPTKHFLSQQLCRMGIASGLAKHLVSFVPDSADERQAWLFVLKLLANRLSIAGHDLLERGGVVALMGPTGTGKTTTVAKLAAQYALRHGPENVAMVTIDTYRIAAFEQLATYGKIIGCQVKQAGNSDELAHILYQLRNKKMILIDSAGFSQRDTRLIQQLSTLENVSNLPIDKYLVVQSSAQYEVLQRTVAAYQNIDLAGCVITKVDECYSLGEAVSVAIENDLPVSYLTHGQKVPEDIKVATAQELVAETAKLYQEYAMKQEMGMHNQYAVNAR